MELTDSPQTANSCRLTFARIRAPASFNFRVMKASSSGRNPFRLSEPPVVSISPVSTLSLSNRGIPCSGPTIPFVFRAASISSAISNARGFTRITAFNAGPFWSNSSIRFRYISVRLRQVRMPCCIARWISAIVASSSTKTLGSPCTVIQYHSPFNFGCAATDQADKNSSGKANTTKLRIMTAVA